MFTVIPHWDTFCDFEDNEATNERYLNEEFQVMFDDLNIEISQDEIKKACKSLKNGKSAGPDYVLNEFLKPLTNFLNFLKKAVVFKQEHL